ncbi:MAG TPA: MotA/TolQ/ExbB proton channel family protein [Firmicutes bacterium]|jgi:biopolymer transport protein ExbB|nr:MotA/TolQ/ExbB proton channel family protein [Bacillota bacterium]
MWQTFLKGGPVMYPLLLCSVIVITIAIERLWYFFSHHGDLDEIKRVVLRLLEKDAPLDAIQYLQRINHPVARVLQAGLVSYGKDLPEMEQNLKDCGELEIRRMERGLALLNSIITAAPLLGLLGTVLGIIKSFQILSVTEGLPSMTAISRGIAEALLTTAAGLIIAVPSLFILHWLNNFVQRRIDQMNLFSKDLLEAYRNRRPEQ